jgi:hypothetical protein
VEKRPAITLAQIRNGDPDTFAALCRQRGGAVLAYCKAIAAPDVATEAAAAFAEFRRAVIAPGSVTSAQRAEDLLRHATRVAAMARVAPDGDRTAQCSDRQTTLVRYFEDALAPADRDAVAAHAARCRACTNTLRRLETSRKRSGWRRMPPTRS